MRKLLLLWFFGIGLALFIGYQIGSSVWRARVQRTADVNACVDSSMASMRLSPTTLGGDPVYSFVPTDTLYLRCGYCGNEQRTILGEWRLVDRP